MARFLPTADLVEDHEIKPRQVFGDLAGFALRLFLLERVDQLDRREKARLLAMIFDGVNAKSGGDTGLAGSRRAGIVVEPVRL